MLAPRALKPSQLETIGRALGDLHVIGKAYKKGIDNRFSFERIADLYLTVRNRLPNYFRKICRTLEDEIEYLTRYLEGKLPKGVIHGDLFADNLLFRGEKMTAMLDFDAACRGKFIFDIATAVNALCFVDGEYSLDRFRYLLQGYDPCGRCRWRNGTRFPTNCAIRRCASRSRACTIFFLSRSTASLGWTRTSANSSIACGCSGARKRAGWRRC